MIEYDSRARRLIAALSTAVLLAGCAHVRSADPAAAGVDLDDLNARLAGRMVLVRLVDGTELIAHDVSVSADSVFFRPQGFPQLESAWPSSSGRKLPTAEVGSIEVTRRSWGAADGALIGFGIGTTGGAALGAANTDAGLSTADAVLVGALVFGVLGTGVGSLIGLGMGSTEVFDLTKAPSGTDTAPGSE